MVKPQAEDKKKKKKIRLLLSSLSLLFLTADYFHVSLFVNRALQIEYIFSLNNRCSASHLFGFLSCFIDEFLTCQR